MNTILIVEDDKNIRKLMQIWLSKANFNVLSAENGEEAIKIIGTESIDLLLVDIMMPIINGFELLEYFQRVKIHIPTIMTTAKESISDKGKCFSLGVDDYMVKPIDREELLMRITAVLRRANVSISNRLTIGSICLDADSLSITSQSETIYLPKKEFNILFKLLSNSDRSFTKIQLMDEFWGLETDSYSETVKVHINRIRSKIAHIKEIDILTIRGVGYKGVIHETT